MTKYEVRALVPEVCVTPPIDGIQYVNFGGFTAIVSEAPKPKIILPMSRKATLVTAAARQAVLEACMQFGPVLPFRPAYHASRSELERMITANLPLLKQLEAQFRGMVQYQITVQWDAARVLVQYRESPELRSLFEQGTVCATALEAGITSLAKRLGHEMAQKLKTAATATLPLPLGPDILVNAVVLIPQDETARLDAAVEAIDQEWSAGLTIRQIGPAPAASFALLNPTKIAPSEIDRARKYLSVTEQGDVEALRKSALRRAPKDAETIRHAAKILTAATLLTDSSDGFHLCSVLSEDRSFSEVLQEVA